jgi:hypothetical protein
MLTTTTAADLLVSAPEDLNKRCAFIQTAIDQRRWSQAAVSLKLAALVARDWADKAQAFADKCTAEEKSGRLYSVVPAAIAQANNAAPLTVEAVEAGLMALAHRLGRDYAVLTRRAMTGVMLAGSPLAAQVHGNTDLAFAHQE